MQPTHRATKDGEQVVVLSARTSRLLTESAERLAGFLDATPDADLADLAFTLQIEREAMAVRYAVVVSSVAELRSRLRADRGRQEAGVASGGLLAEINGDRDLKELLVRRWIDAGKLSRLATLWASGVEVHWEALHRGAPRRVVPLPADPGTAGRRWNLSRGQLAMYRDELRWSESGAYNLPLLFEIHGDLDEAALERAVRAQADIHPVLGAVVRERDAVAYLDIDPARPPSFDRVDIAATSREARLAALRELVDAPFDLAAGPLVRTHLVSLAGRRRLLLITAHHILLDGTSTAVLIRTLKDAYRGVVDGGASQAAYGDFVAWEEALLTGPRALGHRDHWVRELAGPRASLALPYDRPPDRERMPRVDVVTSKLPPAQAAALADLAREHRVSVATVLFATYALLMHRLTGQDDLILGLTTAARYEQRFHDVVGQFANCLPLRIRVAGGFAELLRSVRRAMVAGIEHGAYPLPEIGRALGTDGEPLVLTNFLFQNFEGAELLTHDTRAARGELDLRPFDDLPYAGEFTLSGEIYREGDGYKVFLKYDANVFDGTTARRMIEAWHSIIQNAARRNGATPVR
ncbi:condensation domain-containing protein [Streptomyces sp. ADI96-02]|uniref:condensation domain-containing protein n=1 Tax=Streptomyces sp. ADI96-02 TaxID=1522760 RepID=UPI0013DE7364|nr:condensation domain-containing protein [Streptomyces sp. ADI96-02]